MAKPGVKPIDITSAEIETICAAIRGGCNRNDAAASVGRQWRHLLLFGKRNPEFLVAVAQADADAVKFAEGLLIGKDPEKWLQAHRPDLYGKDPLLAVQIPVQRVEIVVGAPRRELPADIDD